MGRRGIAVAVTAGAAALLVAPVPAASPSSADSARRSARARCFPPGAVEVIRSRETRVYRYAVDGEVVACNYATGRRTWLASPDDGVETYPPPAIDLAGSMVGYVVTDASDPVSTTFTTVRVLSGRSGREKAPFTTLDRYGEAGEVGSLQVTPRAAVAWIVRGHDAIRVWKLDRGSTAPNAPVLLDEGPDIHPRSLGLRGTTLSWIRGGERQRARLE
jgi:hypothetical protein